MTFPRPKYSPEQNKQLVLQLLDRTANWLVNMLTAMLSEQPQQSTNCYLLALQLTPAAGRAYLILGGLTVILTFNQVS
jgi:hypothetical protein